MGNSFQRLFYTVIALLLFTCAYGRNDADSAFTAYAQKQGYLITETNRIKLLTSGSEKFKELFAAIRTAKHSIHLEYFNFRNDSIANALFNLLGQKAKEGV